MTLARADRAQADANARLWARSDLVRGYAHRNLRPVEVMLLVRHRDALAGRVLELGCGAGRLTGYLADIAREVHVIDVSPQMVAACHAAYPGVHARQGDLRDLAAVVAGPFDAVLGSFGVIDVLNDRDRRTLLADVRRILTPDGVLIVSSHNRDSAPPAGPDLGVRHRGLRGAARVVIRGPRWLRNRRRVVRFEHHELDYAVLNDISHDYGALHYYVTRDAQERQLNALGFNLVECLDLDGRPVPPGATATGSSELHYVARLRSPI